MTEETTEVPALSAATPTEAAFAAIVAESCAEIDRQLAAVLISDHESGPHKARVALRRLTTAMDAFAPILRRKASAVLRAEAKWIFRTLGRLRDADVFLAAQDQPPRKLQRETAQLRDAVRAELRARKAVTFAPLLLRALGPDGGLLREKPRGIAAREAPVGQLAGAALDAAWAKALAHGEDPDALTEEELHSFRKDMKTLRYRAEFFAPVWPDAAWPPFRALLQDLQDELGLINDLANARARGHQTDPRREAKAREKAMGHWAALRAAGPFWTAG